MSGRQAQTPSRAIPAKRLSLPDGAPLPPGDYSTTPGGTVFGTTPGGTRIIYDRKFLMECRNSPVAKTSPCDLPDIPGVTSPNVEELKIENNHVHNYEEKPGIGRYGDERGIVCGPYSLQRCLDSRTKYCEEAQFDMDI